jgi:hypothetical protein
LALRPGTLDLVADGPSRAKGYLLVAMTSDVPAVLHAGGVRVMERRYDEGALPLTRFAWVRAQGDTTRFVLSAAGSRAGGRVELHVWDETGRGVPLTAPSPGSQAPGSVSDAKTIDVKGTSDTLEGRALVAMGSLALGEVRRAEAMARGGESPLLALALVRTLDATLDLPPAERAERATAAALTLPPGFLDAALSQARLVMARRTGADGPIEALLELDRRKGAVTADASLLHAFDAALSSQARLMDRRAQAYAQLKNVAKASALSLAVDRVTSPRSSKESAQADCSTGADRDFAAAACYFALLRVGDVAAARTELARLRSLYGAPQLMVSQDLREALAARDLGRADAAWATALPAERSAAVLLELGKLRGKVPAPGELLARVREGMPAGGALGSLLRVAGEDSFAPFDDLRKEGLALEAGGAKAMADAGSVVLSHREEYELDRSGLLRVRIYDLRRVVGTADVDTGAAAAMPELRGQITFQTIKRRIHKKDGRAVLPDRTPNAQQANADLAQLEPGDIVEAAHEAWVQPDDRGQLSFVTSDLLPERTSVRRAQLLVRFPTDLGVKHAAHPLLGTPKQSARGADTTLEYTLSDKAPRRIEDGVPRADRPVSFTASTFTWRDIAEQLSDAELALRSNDAEVAVLATQAVASLPPNAKPKDRVEAVLRAAGQAVRMATPAPLVLASGEGPQRQTARTFLITHEGSRAFVLARALETLGISAQIVFAEQEPASSNPEQPPHPDRFFRPLVKVTHLDGPSSSDTMYLDVEVAGPPLPAGRISPELAGRAVLLPDGQLAAVPSAAGEANRDEVDLRLVLDEKGDAQGSLTVLLRGRAAQELAEAFEKLVGMDRQKALQTIALAWLPLGTVESVQLSSSEGSWQIAIRAEVRVAALAQAEGRDKDKRQVPGLAPFHAVFPRAYAGTLSAVFATKGNRESAFSIREPVFYHMHRRIELPAKALVTRLPGPLKSERLIRAERRIAVAGNAIEEDFELGLPASTIAANDYDAFLSELRRIDAGFLATAQVKLPSP